MRSHFSRELPIVHHRKAFFCLSGALLALAVVGILVRGLVFGIEFVGGTEVDFRDTGSVTISQMRTALSDAGEKGVTVQTAVTDGSAGFLVRSETVDPNVATAHAAKAAESLGLAEDSFQVTTIGPDWGANVTRSSAMAFVLAIVAIVAYVAFRYEPKMSVTAIASLLHDLLITVGVYAWTQTAITPNVVAALLTIMGYSLYDTVVEFHRINENAAGRDDGVHRTYYQIANFSVNEVLVRTINTTVTSLVPVVAMLLLGGATLRDFAFAMLIGLVLGGYSSFGVATPLLAVWKTREPKWAKLEARYGDASAATAGVAAADDAPDAEKGAESASESE